MLHRFPRRDQSPVKPQPTKFWKVVCQWLFNPNFPGEIKVELVDFDLKLRNNLCALFLILHAYSCRNIIAIFLNFIQDVRKLLLKYILTSLSIKKKHPAVVPPNFFCRNRPPEGRRRVRRNGVYRSRAVPVHFQPSLSRGQSSSHKCGVETMGYPAVARDISRWVANCYLLVTISDKSGFHWVDTNNWFDRGSPENMN
jgi:hypothetical protein